MRVIDGWYSTEERGYSRPTPVLHFHGRAADGAYRHWTVDDFRPYFYVAAADLDSDTVGALDAERRVCSVERADRTGVARGERDIDLVKITVEQPYHVRELRDEFERTWEADVLFAQRFLIDQGIKSYCEIPAGEVSLETTDVSATTYDGQIHPRVVTYDIEVLAADGVPDPDSPSEPIIAVSAHDSYTDEIVVFAVPYDDWSGVDVPDCVRLVDSESELIQRFVEWLVERRPDVLTGWNSSSFDDPYFVNRAFHIGEASITRLSPTGSVSQISGSYPNSSVNGIHLFDALDAYKKSQFTELKSYSLADVAAAETDMEKLAVDEQDAYVNDPEQFLRYSKRDTVATRAIIDELDLL